MPAAHRMLAESQISGIHVTNDPTRSGYMIKSKEILLSAASNPETIVHEYAHALERALHVYQDPEFLRIRAKGLENIRPGDIIQDETTFTEPVYRVENPKLISEYQGVLYPSYGIYDGKRVSLDGMREYFSEGYREFIYRPAQLREVDPELYHYIEGLIR